MTSVTQSHSASSPPKPSRPGRLPRSPSDPSQLTQAERAAGRSHSHSASSSTSPSPTSPQTQQIYVLSADGSSLFLLDPSKPSNHEEPPPYAPFRSNVDLRSSDPNIQIHAHGLALSHAEASALSHPVNPSTLNPVPFPSIVVPETSQSHIPRHRASTFSTQARTGSPNRPTARRNHASFSDRTAATSGNGQLTTTRDYRPRSTVSSPGATSHAVMDERTPLLANEMDGEEWIEVDMPKRRKFWRAVFCGELEEGDEARSWGAGWKRFWRPVGQGHYWKAMLHLWLINFPFALFVWPPLVAGTLAGTALLITLPIGAAVWWLTLFISRSAARLETIMQLHYHSPLNPSTPSPTYHPIFHRIKERSAPSSPITPTSELPPDIAVVWEKRFIKCSYAMFSDHYSYSALSYFLLIKPLIVLFSTILLLALFPVAACLIFALPMYLRAARRWGKWQAGVAMENL